MIERRGGSIIAVEADWPDAARIDHYVRHLETPPPDRTAFTRFPTRMWRNREVRELVDWLREHNAGVERERRVGFYGLDLYSLYTSIQAVLAYLDDVDPDAAAVARERYGCLTPWQSDPATYGGPPARPVRRIRLVRRDRGRDASRDGPARRGPETYPFGL